MNLTDLKKSVSDATKMNQADVEKVIKAITASIEEAMKAGDLSYSHRFWHLFSSRTPSQEGKKPKDRPGNADSCIQIGGHYALRAKIKVKSSEGSFLFKFKNKNLRDALP